MIETVELILYMWREIPSAVRQSRSEHPVPGGRRGGFPLLMCAATVIRYRKSAFPIL